MRSSIAVLVLLVACGSKQAPQQKKTCEKPAAGQAMSEDQCKCEGGRVVLSTGGAVEVHCEADEHELGAAKLGDRDGWCCK